jgi:hypothetical protein
MRARTTKQHQLQTRGGRVDGNEAASAAAGKEGRGASMRMPHHHGRKQLKQKLWPSLLLYKILAKKVCSKY